MARHILPWLKRLAAGGAEIWIADPGRAYLPDSGMRQIAAYDVPTSLELEDTPTRRTRLFRMD